MISAEQRELGRHIEPGHKVIVRLDPEKHGPDVRLLYVVTGVFEGGLPRVGLMFLGAYNLPPGVPCRIEGGVKHQAPIESLFGF